MTKNTTKNANTTTTKNAKTGKATKTTKSKNANTTKSKHVHASVDKSFSLVARNDGRTRVINSQGKGIAIYFGSKVLTVASHDGTVIKALAKKYKGIVSESNNLGSNKHLVKISNYTSVIEVLESVFGKYNSRKNVKAQEKDTKTVVAKSTKTGKSKTDKSTKTIDTTKSNTINSEVLKAIVNEVS